MTTTASRCLRTIGATVAVHAERHPEHTAILGSGRRPLRYGELHAAMLEVAETLRALGLGPRDRVALVLPNGPEMAVAFLGVAAATGCAPLNPAYGEDDLAFFFTDLGVRAVVTSGDGAAAAAGAAARAAARSRSLPVLELVPAVGGAAGLFRLDHEARSVPAHADATNEEDVALVLHTSGTTARPKVVPLTHRNLTVSADSIRRTLALDADDVCLNLMPLFHIHGLVGALLSSIAAGGAVFCTSGFRRREFLDELRDSRATWYTAVPTIHHAVVEAVATEPRPLERCRLRFVRSSSAPLPPRTMYALAASFGVPVIEAYGMTEASHQMASNPLPPRRQKPGSVGPAAGADIAIMDEAGQMLPNGSIGEVVVLGDGITRGYEANPAANAAAFTGGWFRTGDQGYLDAHGYLFLTGRLKELINRGGEKIAPREVEEALLRHPEVAQAVAFAVPHDRLGEEVGAAVVLKPGARADARGIAAATRAHLPHFKMPRRLEVVAEIPKSATGKVQRGSLARELGLLERGASSEPPRTQLERDLAREWERLLEQDGIGVDDDFFALGGDSLAAMELVLAASEILGTPVPILDFVERPTIAGLVEIGEHGLAAGTTEPGATAHARLVPMRTGGDGPPLFCVSAHDGNLVRLSRLFPPSERERPIYGLRAPAIAASGPIASIEDLADFHIDAIRRVHDEGSFHLLGCCFGGVVAYEMARRLQHLGRPVASLTLLNAFNRAWRRTSAVPSQANLRAGHLVRRMRHHWTSLHDLDRRGRLDYLRARAKLVYEASRNAAGQKCFDALVRAGRPLPAVFRKSRYASTWALDRYVPGPYPGDVLILRSVNPIAGVYCLDHHGWAGVVTGKAVTVDLPCGPLDLWTRADVLRRIAVAVAERVAATDPADGAQLRTARLH